MGYQVKVDVTDQELIDLVITAVEGGMSGWARLANYNPTNGTVKLQEADPGTAKPYMVTPHTMFLGLQLAATKHPHIFASWIQDRIGDAIIADAILQLGTLGEIVYG